MSAKFDFIQSYRDIDESASREIVDARHKSFEKLSSSISGIKQIYDLCCLAYQVEPFAAESWFEEPVREFDPHFVARKDKIDAGRIAALLLREQLASHDSDTALAVIAASYCGRRRSADGDVLTSQANDELLAAVESRRVSEGAKLGVPAKFKSIKTETDAVGQQNPAQGSVVKTAIDAAAAASEAAVKALAETVRGPINAVREDVARLAEEVDMLWWCIGDWHELLKKPRADTAAGLKMVVSGIELGAMVHELPGPYGAYGILRRISGAEAAGKSSLQAAVKSLTQDDARKLSKDIPDGLKPLFPIHTAIGLVVQYGTAWESEFSKAIPDLGSLELSHYELGIQAFRERALVVHGGLN
jgi:hypothetical protein